MKAECVRERLRAAVALVEKITGKHLSLPVLNAILVEATSDQLVLKATNLDLGIELSVPATVEKKGIVAVPGSLFGTVLGSVADEHSLKLESVNDNLYLSGSHHSTLLRSLPTEDFPSIPRIDGGESFSIHSSRFVQGLRATWYAASVSDMKPEIASVNVYSDVSAIVCVATDSFRLAEKRIEVEEKFTAFPPMLIPIKNVIEIIRILEQVNGNLVITANKNQVSFTAPSLYLTSRLVGGVFLNYRQIIPVGYKTLVTIPKRELTNALKMGQIFSDKFSQVQFKIMPKEQLFEISSRNTETGETTTRVDAALEGEELEIGFNVRYILDCFQSIPEESVTLSFNGVGKTMLVNAVGNNSFTYLVMPMTR